MHHAAPEHAAHDTTLIAAHAAGDPSSDPAAAALLASCSSCAELHRDLIAISAATRTLPRTARAPRDYRLTPEEALRLRRGSWLRSLLRPFGARGAVSRQLAPALTSLGLAGILVALIVPGLLGGAASAPARDRAATGQVASAPAPEVAEAPGAMGAAGAPTDGTEVKAQGAGGPSATDDSNVEMALGGATRNGADDAAGGGQTSTGTPARLAATSSPSPLVIGSVALLLAGLALFALRFAARRLR